MFLLCASDRRRAAEGRGADGAGGPCPPPTGPAEGTGAEGLPRSPPRATEPAQRRASPRRLTRAPYGHSEDPREQATVAKPADGQTSPGRRAPGARGPEPTRQRARSGCRAGARRSSLLREAGAALLLPGEAALTENALQVSFSSVMENARAAIPACERSSEKTNIFIGTGQPANQAPNCWLLFLP